MTTTAGQQYPLGVSLPLPGTVMNYQGAYSSTTAYNVNDVVTQAGSTYICVAANTNQPVSNTLYWTPLGSSGGSGGGSLILPAYTAPSALSGWAWVNQGTATARQNTSQAIEIHIPDNAALNWRALTVATPATPWKVQAAIRSWQVQANSQNTGLYLFDATNKGFTFEFLSQSTNGIVLRVERISNPTTDSVTVATLGGQSSLYPFSPMAGVVFLQIRSDGTTLYFDWSLDGENFTNLYSEAVGSWITPTKVGFGGISVTSNAANYVKISLLGWQFLGNATL